MKKKIENNDNRSIIENVNKPEFLFLFNSKQRGKNAISTIEGVCAKTSPLLSKIEFLVLLHSTYIKRNK